MRYLLVNLIAKEFIIHDTWKVKLKDVAKAKSCLKMHGKLNALDKYAFYFGQNDM